MRKNTVEVFQAWFLGRECRKHRSIWTDGETVYSYGTAIATNPETFLDEMVIFNATKYSPTTSAHQNGIRKLVEFEGLPMVTVDGVPIGSDDEALLDAAEASGEIIFC